MYKISVPFMLNQIEKYGAEPFISRLKEIEADIVFLSLDCYETDTKKMKKVFFVRCRTQKTPFCK